MAVGSSEDDMSKMDAQEESWRVLVAEDDAVTRTMLKRDLENQGFEVVAVADGSKALAVLEKEHFPFLITDWNMPGLSGVELCAAARKMETDSYVYMLIITAEESRRKVIEGLEAGADDYLRKPIHPGELVARLNTGKRILALERRLLEANRRIAALSETDDLTGAYNRRYLSQQLPNELERSERYGRPLSIVMCDIDHFKNVNDTYGHHVGDQVLRAFANLLADLVRDKVDWVARYGGEEFTIILPETRFPYAQAVGERLRKSVAERGMAFGEHSFNITCSFGITAYHPDESRKPLAEEFMAYADSFLYHCKDAGRNRVLGEPFKLKRDVNVEWLDEGL